MAGVFARSSGALLASQPAWLDRMRERLNGATMNNVSLRIESGRCDISRWSDGCSATPSASSRARPCSRPSSASARYRSRFAGRRCRGGGSLRPPRQPLARTHDRGGARVRHFRTWPISPNRTASVACGAAKARRRRSRARSRTARARAAECAAKLQALFDLILVSPCSLRIPLRSGAKRADRENEVQTACRARPQFFTPAVPGPPTPRVARHLTPWQTSLRGAGSPR